MPDAPHAGPDRRSRHEATDHRRRRAERVEDFRLRRDQLLLFVGIGGILLMALLNSTVGFKDIGVALSLVAVFAGLAGAPTVLSLDERRRERRDRE